MWGWPSKTVEVGETGMKGEARMTRNGTARNNARELVLVLGFALTWTSFQKAFYLANFARADLVLPMAPLALGVALGVGAVFLVAYGDRVAADFRLRRRLAFVSCALTFLTGAAVLLFPARGIGIGADVAVEGAGLSGALQPVFFAFLGFTVAISLLCWVAEAMRVTYEMSLPRAVIGVFLGMFIARVTSMVSESIGTTLVAAIFSAPTGLALWCLFSLPYAYEPISASFSDASPDTPGDSEKRRGGRRHGAYAPAIALLFAIIVLCEFTTIMFGPTKGGINVTRDATTLTLFVGMTTLLIIRERGVVSAETARQLWFLMFGCIVGLFLGFLYAALTGELTGSVRADASFTSWALVIILLFLTLLLRSYESASPLGPTWGLLFLLPLCLDAVLKVFVWQNERLVGEGTKAELVALVVLVGLTAAATGTFLYALGSSEAMRSLLGIKSEPVKPTPPYPGTDLRSGTVQLVASEFGLTPRETDIIDCLAHGYTVKAIAESLHISTGTVQTHMKRLYAKMNVHSRQDVIGAIERYAK